MIDDPKTEEAIRSKEAEEMEKIQEDAPKSATGMAGINKLERLPAAALSPWLPD